MRGMQMIIDYYYPEDEWEGVGKPHVYMRHRGADGALVELTIDPNDTDIDFNTYITSHCWVAANTHPRRLSRVTARYPGTRVRYDITATGLDGVPLMRFDVPNPAQLYDIRNEIRTYEGDINYNDILIRHMYPDTRDMPSFEPRIWYFDMEWQPKGCPNEGATTMIAIDDTHAEHPVVFAWKSNPKVSERDVIEDRDFNQIDFIEREGGYMLYMCKDEDAMHEAFLEHLEECDPDMLVAHSILWADLPQLIRRLGNESERLSPVRQVIRPHKKNRYRENSQPILGRLCYDTALSWEKGSGLEAMWQKSGRGQFRNKQLATIAEDLELDKEFGEEGAKMDADVFTWWIDNFDEFVDYCVRDTTLLRKCAEKVKAIPYHLAMQKHCGVSFRSTCNVSNYIRGLISRETDVKALTTFHRQRDDYKAATVPDTVGGRHENVACVDFKAMYPIIIVDANLCPTTKRERSGEGIRSVPNGTHWDRKKGVLPTIISSMLELRAEYKKLLKSAKTDDEKLQYDMMQTAIKVATNAAYGYVSQKKIGGGWIDPDIGSTITYYGRECISTLLLESEKAGYRALAGHTDSGYIQIPFDETQSHIDNLNKLIRDKYDLPSMEIELEAYFAYWLTADVKNQNFGIFTWPEEKKGQLKVTGFSYKASSVSPITKEVQGQIFKMIGTGAEENEVTSFIRPIALSVMKGERGVDELAPYGRIGKDKYVNKPPMAVRGGYYYNEHINPREPFKTGDSLQWVYVKASPDNLPHTNVVGFRNVKDVDGFVIDHHLCVDKFIRAKIKNIYSVLDWDVEAAVGAARPKKHW
jgi:DNA polymerase, archaea type